MLGSCHRYFTCTHRPVAQRPATAGWIFLCAAVLAAGCAGPASRPIRPEDARRFGPVPKPADFDPQRAKMTLDEIPGGPEPPARARLSPVELPRQALRKLEKMRESFAQGRYEQAIQEADDALRYHDDIQEAHRFKALACRLTGRIEKAREHAQRALELKSDDIACHWLLGRLAQQAGDDKEALRRYRLAIQCEPDPATNAYLTLTHHDLGILLHRLGYEAAAAAELERFFRDCLAMIRARRAPTCPELAAVVGREMGSAMQTLARAYSLLGRDEAAADALGAAVRISPEDRSLRAEWICALVRAGKIRRAESAARQFMSDCDACPESLDLLVSFYRYTGRPDRTVEVLRIASEQNPERVDLALAYADALLAAGRQAQAVKVLDRVVRAHPDASEARWKLISISRAEGHWLRWLEAMARQVQAGAPEYDKVCDELARIDAASAGAMVDAALAGADPSGRWLPAMGDGDPLKPAVDYLAGRLAQRLDRTTDAERLFQRAVRADPTFVPAVVALAEVYVRRHQWQEAIAILDPARQKAARPVADLERLRGRCSEGLDQLDEAESLYKKAHQLDPRDSRPLYRLAAMYERTGRPNEALAQFKAIVEIDPKDLRAREGVVRLLWSRIAQSGHAMEVVRQITEMQRLNRGLREATRTVAQGSTGRHAIPGGTGQHPDGAARIRPSGAPRGHSLATGSGF